MNRPGARWRYRAHFVDPSSSHLHGLASGWGEIRLHADHTVPWASLTPVDGLCFGADEAQLGEQLTRNEQLVRSSRIVGFECMGLPPRAPPLAPAGSSGSASGPWLEEAEAAGFDQSPPDDWALGA